MPVTSTSLSIERRGVVEYLEALEMQRTIHKNVASNNSPNTLLLLQHPSTYTAGKRTIDSERPDNGSPVIDVDRGGKITWHGPGQLVGYPIIRLRNPHELVGFVREIEGALIEACAALGVLTQRVDGRSGVWVVDEKGSRKIAAIGIRVASGTSMHGFALNVNPDLTPFQNIIPCGIDDADVTSLALELGRNITVDEVTPIIEKTMNETLAKVSA